MIEQMITLGYWSAAGGFVLCAIGYFAFPAMLKHFSNGDGE